MPTNKNSIGWKKIIPAIILIFLIIIFIYMMIVYRQVMLSKQTGFKQVSEFVVEQTEIEEISSTSYFQAEDGYYILTGQDEPGENWYVYIMDDGNLKKENIILQSFTKSLPVEELTSSWKNDCNNCELINSTPAMIDDVPLWEFTYIDDSNRYVMEYKNLTDGTTYEKIRFTRK